MIDRIEVGFDVAVDDELVAAATREPDLLERLRRASLRPEPVRAFLEAGLEDRLDHDLHGHLRDAIAHRGNPQGSLLPVRLRNVPSLHRLRSVLARRETLREVREELGDALLLDRLDGLSIDAGSSIVAPDPPPRFRQDVTPADPIK